MTDRTTPPPVASIEDRCVIACDLDGTLAHYSGFKGPGIIGAPIMRMVRRIRRALAAGHEVRIFTARVADPAQAIVALPAIQAYTKQHIGVMLPVTCIKTADIDEFWDDRARHAVPNTGLLVGGSRAALEHLDVCDALDEIELAPTAVGA